MLKFQAALSPVKFAPHDNVGSHEADDLKIIGELCCIPDSPVVRFQPLPFSRCVLRFHCAVELRQTPPADFFCRIDGFGHRGNYGTGLSYSGIGAIDISRPKLLISEHAKTGLC